MTLYFTSISNTKTKSDKYNTKNIHYRLTLLIANCSSKCSSNSLRLATSAPGPAAPALPLPHALTATLLAGPPSFSSPASSPSLLPSLSHAHSLTCTHAACASGSIATRSTIPLTHLARLLGLLPVGPLRRVSSSASAALSRSSAAPPLRPSASFTHPHRRQGSDERARRLQSMRGIEASSIAYRAQAQDSVSSCVAGGLFE